MEQVIRNGALTRKHGFGGRLPRFAAVMCFALAVMAPHSLRAAPESLEYKVKAAFLLNFTKFIEWPATAFAGPGSPFSICILGEDPFGRMLDELVEGEVVDGRKVEVQRLKAPPSPKSCQLLFVAKSESDLPALLQGLGPGLLTLGETEDFIGEGGMIAFVIENRRVRFDINLTAAENSGLKLSARLLNVARSVKR